MDAIKIRNLSKVKLCPECGTELQRIHGEDTPEARKADELCGGQFTTDLVVVCPKCGVWDYFGYD